MEESSLETPDRQLRRRRLRLFKITGGIIVVLVGGGSTYLYIDSAEQRAEKQFQEGMLLMGPGSYSDAIERFDRSLQIWPRFPRTYLQRGSAHQILGETDAALADFNRALELDPELVQAHT